MFIEKKEQNFSPKELFPNSKEKYNQLYENKDIRERVILQFLQKSENNRRLGCWQRNWREIIHGRDIEGRKPGKELENVLVEIFSQFLGESFEIFLASYEDDKKGKDIIFYCKEKDILFSIDLTMNGNYEILKDKIAHFRYDNPSSLEVPPEQRKNNRRVIRFFLYLPRDCVFEIMTRFYEKIKNNELEKIKNDPLSIAIFYEFLEQMKLELEKIRKIFPTPSIKFDEKDIEDSQNLFKIISSQKEELNKKLTPEVEKMIEYLKREREKKLIKILEKLIKANFK